MPFTHHDTHNNTPSDCWDWSAQGALSRRGFLAALASGAAAGMLGCSLAPFRKRGPRPNVLFIAVDDLRPQLGCFGQRQMISPNIDRLAREGVLFRQAYCQVPVCGASRGSLLSGVRPTAERLLKFDTSIDHDLPDVLTLPRHFKDNGYETISLGKVYHQMNDDRDGWAAPPWRPKNPGYLNPESLAVRAKTLAGLKGDSGAGKTLAGGPPVECADVDDSQCKDGALADRAIQEMRRMKGRPFFLATGFFKPHLPFCAPKRYWDLYKRDEINLADNPFQPKGAPRSALFHWAELRGYAGIPKAGPVSDDQARELIHGYYACVSFVDAQVGRLLDELDRLNLRDNTIVVLWGDHGWQLGEHGLWCKHTNFETSLHAPLIVSAPGLAPGAQSPALVEFVDIYPSLCDLAGLSKPKHLEGLSFAPVLKEPDRPWKKAAFSRYADGDSVKTGRYRYTEWKRKGEDKPFEWMMYDHQKDPHENVNIANVAENRKIVEEMRGLLRQGWRAGLP